VSAKIQKIRQQENADISTTGSNDNTTWVRRAESHDTCYASKYHMILGTKSLFRPGYTAPRLTHCNCQEILLSLIYFSSSATPTFNLEEMLCLHHDWFNSSQPIGNTGTALRMIFALRLCLLDRNRPLVLWIPWRGTLSLDCQGYPSGIFLVGRKLMLRFQEGPCRRGSVFFTRVI